MIYAHALTGFPTDDEKKEALLEQATNSSDVVNSPSHYQTFPNQEAIDIIKQVLTKEEFAGYCKGNFLKYKLRAGDKDDVGIDVAKAQVYQRWLMEDDDA